MEQGPSPAGDPVVNSVLPARLEGGGRNKQQQNTTD